MTDPDLAAKVAEVMGREVMIDKRTGCCGVPVQLGNTPTVFEEWAFAPDEQGADYCDVHLWLLDNGYTVFTKRLGDAYICLIKSRDGTERRGIGAATPELAMCLAMVSEGGE